MHLVRVVADHGDPRSRRGEASRGIRRLAEDRRADDENRVVRLEPLPQPPSLGGQHAAEQPVVLRKSRAAAERLLEDRSHEALGQLHERCPRLLVIRPRTDDERRGLRLCEKGHESIDRLGRCSDAAPHGPRRSGRLTLLVGRLLPVVHRHDHERRPALRLRRVERALDRSRNVLRERRLVDADRILARQPRQPPRKERLVREMAPVLLTHDDDERRPVHAGGRDGADPGAKPGRRMQENERRPATADRET